MRAEAAQIRRWRFEPWTFVRQVLGAEPDFWQLEFLYALVGRDANGNPMPKAYMRFALQACKGPGKSTVLAWAMWWFMLTRLHPKIVACSITADNLKDNLWAELSKWQKRSSLLTTTFTWTQDRIYDPRNQETWFMSARSFPKSASPQQQADTLAGIHADAVMFVLDESGGIPPGVLATADAGLANVGEGREAFLLQAGNPTDVTGALFQAAVTQRPLWWVKEISGDPDDPRRAARVSIEWAREQIRIYGRNHPFVLVNVLGRFPPGGANTLISLHDVTAARDRKLTPNLYHDFPLILGVDIARFGDDETAMCLRQGPLVHPIVTLRNSSTMNTAGQVIRMMEEHEPDAVFIDVTGIGAGVVDRLIELNHEVVGIEFGSASDDPACFNKRAEMWWSLSKWVRGQVAIPDDPHLISELPAPMYKFHSDGKIVIESKEDMKKRGLPSPDRADALGLTFAMRVPRKKVRQQFAQTKYDWRTGLPG